MHVASHGIRKFLMKLKSRSVYGVENYLFRRTISPASDAIRLVSSCLACNGQCQTASLRHITRYLCYVPIYSSARASLIRKNGAGARRVSFVRLLHSVTNAHTHDARSHQIIHEVTSSTAPLHIVSHSLQHPLSTPAHCLSLSRLMLISLS